MRAGLTKKKTLLFLLVFTSFIPNVGVKVVTFGFNWILYRIAMPICLLLYFSMKKGKEQTIIRKENRNWIILMLFWIIYGVFLLLFSPYQDPHNGFVELIALFNGLICMFALGNSIENKKDFEWVINIAYYVCFVLILYGVFEVLTGFHLPMSEFRDTTYHEAAVYSDGATGTFYGVNDFSTFLTTLTPLFFYFSKKKFLNCLAIMGILFVNYYNDANICTIALFIGIVFYYVFLRNYNVKQKRILRVALVIMGIIILLVLLVNLSELSKKISLFYVLNTQIHNISLSQGSLWMRLTIYLDSLRAALDTYFLGIGPSAFTNYFLIHPSASGLVNPHNLYLEILVEYGGLISIGFICLIVRLIYKFRKRIMRCEEKNERRKMSVFCEMVLIYSIVCISSSSFIDYAWQWVVLCLGSVMIGMQEKQCYNVETERLNCVTGYF